MIFAALSCLVFLAPLPLSVEAPAVVRHERLHRVYVTEPGRLRKIHVRSGQVVKAGEPLASLVAPELNDSYVEARTALLRQDARVRSLRAAGAVKEEAVAIRTRLALYEQGIERLGRLQRLTVTAPCAGTVIAAQDAASSRVDPPDGSLWRPSGVDLEAAPVGAYVDRGTHLLSLAPINGWEAIIALDEQAEQEFQVGAEVRLKLANAPRQTIEGRVRDITRWAPQSATHSSDAPLHAVISFDPGPTPLVEGQACRARVTVSHRTTWDWIARFVRLNFRAPL